MRSRCDYRIFILMFHEVIYTTDYNSFDCGFRIKHVQHFLPKKISMFAWRMPLLLLE